MAACTKIINIGDKFNRWTVIGESDKRTGGYIWWECECSCDNHTRKLVKGRDLRNGNSKSCGCLMKEVNAERLKNTLKDENAAISVLQYSPALTWQLPESFPGFSAVTGQVQSHHKVHFQKDL